MDTYTGVVRLFILVTIFYSSSGQDQQCPDGWPRPSNSPRTPSCSCQFSRPLSGLVAKCSSLNGWPNAAPTDAIRSLVLDESNRIPETLGGITLSGLVPKLSVFRCNNCGIRGINAMAFFGLNNLDKIDFSGSNIPVLHKEAFMDLNGLSVINLSNCKIVTIEKGAFRGARNIGTLYLDHNDLSAIEPGAFHGVTNISTISMEFITALTLPGYSLKGLNNVTLLSFTFSEIKKLESYAFFGVTNTNQIQFTSSKLTTIQPLAFVGIGATKIIKMEQTQVSTLQCGVFEGLNCVRQIDWNWAPLRCDCNMQWMVETARNMSQDLTKNLRCYSPSFLTEKSPMSLGLDELGCDQEERFMGCPRLDTRHPRVKPLERYLEEIYGENPRQYKSKRGSAITHRQSIILASMLLMISLCS